MEGITGLAGTAVITSKVMYYVSGIGYIFVSIFCFVATYTLPETSDFSNQQLACSKRRNELEALT